MQLRRFVVALGAAVLMVGPASAQLSGLKPPPPDKRVVAKGRRFALIVGVGEAKPPGFELEKLPGCIDDAHALAKALKAAGYQTTVLTEKDLAPNKANVTSSLQKVCAAATEDDQVVLYFSTHGGAPKNVPSLALKDDLIPLKSIKAELAKSKALVKIILLDACRDQKGFPTETTEYRDIHTILSCRPDEESTFGPTGLSAFTEVLVEALTDCKADRYKDGRIDLDEVLIYLDEHVPERAAMTRPGHPQNPTRTVVDPRALNPVLAMCVQPAKPTDPVPVAVVTPVISGSRNDLVLPSQLVGKVTLGMTARQFLAGAGSKAPPFTLDQNGRGSAVMLDVPAAGDEVRVEFVNGLVTRVQNLHLVKCAAASDLNKARAGWNLYAGRTPDKEVTKPFEGMGPDQVFGILGCPIGGALKLTIMGSGEVAYQDVPLDGNFVKFSFERGVVSHVSLTRVWCNEKNFDPARAVIFLAKASEAAPDNQLSEKLGSHTIKMIVDGMGCPPGGPLLIDETGTGSAVYPDFPKKGDLTTFNFLNSKVRGVFVDRAVEYLALPNVNKARKGFATLADGQDDQHVNDAVRGKSPEQLAGILGAPSAPTRLDGNGMGYATYDNIPEEGDKFTILFHKRAAIGAQIDRRVK